MSDRPIDSYALLSDCHTAALVGRDGAIDWYCVPDFDSPALFGALLDRGAGFWRIAPAEPARVSRRYLDRTLVLETTFASADATFVLQDALALGDNQHGHQLGGSAPRQIVRHVACSRGEGTVEVCFRPRPEYGLVQPLLRHAEGGLYGRGGAAQLALSAQLPMHVDHEGAHGSARLRAGESLAFALQYRTVGEPPPAFLAPDAIAASIATTAESWRHWSDAHQSYDAPWWPLVAHSGRVLQGLTYQPTGAIVAAPTTSLPEWKGGARNWDYRFTWLRDASLTLDSLWVAACPDEAHQFFDFLGAVALTRVRAGEPPQILYGIRGEHDVSERLLPHLAGWNGSRPVRVGNDAWRQRQHDVFGEVLGAALRLRRQIAGIDSITREFLRELADAAAVRWQHPDHGIWEQRTPPRHFLHSKLMCWVALDAACALADEIDGRPHVDRWRAAADEIRRTILSAGWDPRLGAFTQSFGDPALDSSALLLPIVGFLPGDDPRMRSTIAAIRRELSDGRGLLRRYRSPDGLAGEEGSFLLCSFWLAHALALAGDVGEAHAVFARAAAHANDVGLLAEEAHPVTGEALGNFPQAFSHVGLVNARWAIAEAERRGHA